MYTYDKFNIRYYMALIVRDECRKDVNVNGFPKHDHVILIISTSYIPHPRQYLFVYTRMYVMMCVYQLW